MKNEWGWLPQNGKVKGYISIDRRLQRSDMR